MQAQATVIIPTYGKASFARWAIKSVQQQTVRDIEICIICDGSPEEMVAYFKDMVKDDPRLSVYTFPKSPRTGEPYRDRVIMETTGRIICYCGHDDLWLPFHIEAVEKTLQQCDFTHSIHAFVNLPERIQSGRPVLRDVQWIEIGDPRIVERMLGGQNFFGLTYGAHTRSAYLQLQEGWTTTPDGVATDLYMWCKFLSAFRQSCRTTPQVTALNFQKSRRKDLSEEQRDEELKGYFDKIQDPVFLKKICRLASTFVPVYPSPYQKLRFFVLRRMRRLIAQLP